MSVKVLKNTREVKDLTNYGVAKALREVGVDTSASNIDAYERHQSRRMRLDILCGLRKISGKSWAEFGRWLDEDFLPK